MTIDFVAALEAEMAALREALGRDVRYVRLREIEKLRELYRDPADATDGAASVLMPSGTNEARPQHRPPVRRASPERAQAMDAARLYVLNRAGPAPTTDVYDHLVGLGLTIRGENPVNNLSAMMSNSGLFKANGRAGWTIRQSGDADDSDADVEEDGEPSPDDARDAQIDREIDRMVELRQRERTPTPPSATSRPSLNDDGLPPPQYRPSSNTASATDDFVAHLLRMRDAPRKT